MNNVKDQKDKLKKLLENIAGRLTFCEATHKYLLDKHRAISTTTLINNVYSREKIEKLKRQMDMEFYANWGTRIHKAIEDYLDKDIINETYQSNIEDAVRAFKDAKIVHYFTEAALCSEMFISGLADVIAIDTEGTIVIMDWKSSSRPLWEHKIQNELYRYMLREQWHKMYGVFPKVIGYCVYTPREPAKGKYRIDKHTNISKEAILAIEVHKVKLIQYGIDYYET